jgi:putative ABC transport system permease protein
VELADPSQAAELAAAIRDLVGDAFQVESWTERERASYLFLETTRWMALAVILGITAVAAIGVYSTLLLSVLHNRSKIAVLMALGIRNRSIYMALLSSALFMGLIGLILGSLVGYFGSELLIVHFAESLERLGLDDPSTAIGPGDLLLAGCATFGLFALTAVVPARRAVAMDPIENLHR